MLKIFSILTLSSVFALVFSSCAHKDKFVRPPGLDSTQEVDVVGTQTKLVLHNVRSSQSHELSRNKETSLPVGKASGPGIRCEAIHVLPRSSQSTVVTQAHKDIFNFKRREILEERRTQTDAPFYTNRFKFTYTFQQQKSNPGMDRQEVSVICQTEFASLQPSMDLTIKEINDIFKTKIVEIKNQLTEADSKDVIY